MRSRATIACRDWVFTSLSAAHQHLQKYDHNDCLINNAGVFAGRQRELTKEGYELTYGTNVQALYLVTCLLLSKVGFVIPAGVRTHQPHPSHAFKQTSS